jgi:hypothetical protein
MNAQSCQWLLWTSEAPCLSAPAVYRPHQFRSTPTEHAAQRIGACRAWERSQWSLGEASVTYEWCAASNRGNSVAREGRYISFAPWCEHRAWKATRSEYDKRDVTFDGGDMMATWDTSILWFAPLASNAMVYYWGISYNASITLHE